ncbi:MAG: hypothetical protein Q7S03_00630 [bacterium]|nr:hypothetical protein [bacterium]
MSNPELFVPKEKPFYYSRISFDVDGVLAKLVDAMIVWVNQHYGTEYRLEDCSGWGFLEKMLKRDFGLTDEEADQMWANPEVVLAGEPYPGSAEVLQDLMRRGTEVFFCTARSPKVREATLEWFAKYYPFVERKQIYIRTTRPPGGTSFKKAAIQSLGVDLHVEDSAELANSLNGTKVLLIDRPWNQGTEVLLRRKSWEEIQRFIVSGE